MLTDLQGAPLNKVHVPEVDQWARQALELLKAADSRVKEFIDKNPQTTQLVCAAFAMGNEITRTCAVTMIRTSINKWPEDQNLTGSQVKELLNKLADEMEMVGRNEVEVPDVRS